MYFQYKDFHLKSTNLLELNNFSLFILVVFSIIYVGQKHLVWLALTGAFWCPVFVIV